MIRKACVSSALLATACTCLAQTPAFTTTVDNLAKEDVSLNKIPGMAVAVTDGSKIAFEKTYGSIAQPNGSAVNGNTVFHIGGLSQSLTAFAIMQLADQGKIKLDDPASKYLTDMPKNWKAITVRQFLDNSSGVPAIKGGADWDEALDEVDGKPLEFTPGSQEKRSTTNYALLGKLIEAVSGKSYSKYMKENVFQPLGMNRTGFGIADENVATGYKAATGTPAKVNPKMPDYYMPIAGIQSSLNDLLKWEDAMFSGRVLKAATYHEMFKPSASTTSVKREFTPGWQERTMYQNEVVFSGGSAVGASSLMEIDLHRGVAVIILENIEGTKGQLGALGSSIMKETVGVVRQVPPRPGHRAGVRLPFRRF